jgi:hypothetical protein
VFTGGSALGSAVHGCTPEIVAVIAALADWALAGAFMGRVTTRQALVDAPAARVLFRLPEGTPDAGHAPFTTEMVKGSARADGVMVAATVADRTRGTSPVLVIEKVPVTDLPGVSADQLRDCDPTVSAEVPALIVEPGVAVAEELR